MKQLSAHCLYLCSPFYSHNTFYLLSIDGRPSEKIHAEKYLSKKPKIYYENCSKNAMSEMISGKVQILCETFSKIIFI